MALFSPSQTSSNTAEEKSRARQGAADAWRPNLLPFLTHDWMYSVCVCCEQNLWGSCISPHWPCAIYFCCCLSSAPGWSWGLKSPFPPLCFVFVLIHSFITGFCSTCYIYLWRTFRFSVFKWVRMERCASLFLNGLYLNNKATIWNLWWLQKNS